MHSTCGLPQVEILDVGPLAGDEWGFTGTFHKDNGGGFLTDHYPEATKACWDFEGVYAQSRHIPGVRFAGLIHPGLIGTAPSHAVRWVDGRPPRLAWMDSGFQLFAGYGHHAKDRGVWS